MSATQITFEQALVIVRAQERRLVNQSMLITASIFTVLILMMFVNTLFYGTALSDALTFLFGALGIIATMSGLVITINCLFNR